MAAKSETVEETLNQQVLHAMKNHDITPRAAMEQLFGELGDQSALTQARKDELLKWKEEWIEKFEQQDFEEWFVKRLNTVKATLQTKK